MLSRILRRAVRAVAAGSLLLITALARPTACPAVEPSSPPELVFPAAVTEYDVATSRELFYRRHVAPVVASTAVAEWPVWEGLEEAVGGWVRPYVEAERVAATIQGAFPVGTQPPVKALAELTADCARVLTLKPPAVFVRNSPLTLAYVTEIDGRPMLTLTSGLLELYEGRPAELRFVVGREFGRVRCGHVGLRTKAYAVFAALQAVNVAAVPDEYQLVLPTLALGRLMSLFRETEFSADRAGLLCCQDPDVAFQAMLRQLHGLRAASVWIDPNSPEFDPQEYLRRMEPLEHRPLVRFIQEARGYASESPFVPERIAQLAVWAESDAYREILARAGKADGPDPDQLVTVRSVTIRNVADAHAGTNPYVVGYASERKLFSTTVAKGMKSARWPAVDVTHAVADGQPLFFEIWDEHWGPDGFLGGFVVYPRNPAPGESDGKAVLNAPLEWDWYSRTDTARQGLGEVTLEFSTRPKGTQP